MAVADTRYQHEIPDTSSYEWHRVGLLMPLVGGRRYQDLHDRVEGIGP